MKKLVFLILIFAFCSASAYEKENIMLEMSDGIKLYTDIYKPTLQNDFPLPVVLVRSPYGAESFGSSAYFKILIGAITNLQRYVFVLQDLRGTNNSEGENTIFLEDGWGEKRDGYETIEWLAEQDWCDGRVAMFGPSALAITQYLAAGANPPHFVCGMPMVGAWDMYQNCVYPGGEFRKADVEDWVRDYANNDMLPVVKENYNYTEMWHNVNCNNRVGEMQQPMLHFGGWYDFFHPGQLEAFYNMQYNGGEGARGRQKIIIGPWTHSTLGSVNVGDISFPLNATYDYFTLAIDWLNYNLKDSTNNRIADLPTMRLYLMGPDDKNGRWNKWLGFEEWPFDNTDTLNFYLGQKNNMLDDMPYNTITHLHGDPLNPVPTIGGNNLFLDAGPKDQSSITMRDDVLFYESEMYDQPYDIFGRVRLFLSMSANRRDVDIAARLVDIYPDGRRMLITDGILMARHRNGFDIEELLTPNDAYDIEIDLNYTAYTIAPGHRLGLIISTSNYPKFKINPNTGDPVHTAEQSYNVDVSIFTQGDRVSRLELPIRKTGFTSVRRKELQSESEGRVVRNNELRIMPPSGRRSTGIIYDISGRKIDELNIASSQTPVNITFNYPSGFYIMILNSGTKTKAIRIINP